MSACLLTLTASARGPEEMAAVKKKLDEAKPTMDALTGTTDTAVFRKREAARDDDLRWRWLPRRASGGAI